MPSLRFRVSAADVPPPVAARRLGLTLAEFDAKLSNLIERGFPRPDPDTGNFDLDAIDVWRRSRHAHLFPGTAEQAPRSADVIFDRLKAMDRG